MHRAAASSENLSTLESAYHIAFSSGSRDGGSTRELGSALESIEEINPFKLVNDFYEANADLIHCRDLTDGSVEDSLGRFTETAQATVKGLNALSQLHPFVGVAVGAFVVVITLDLARRDNDRKVLAVKMQMQDLMAVFFELRHIRDSYEPGRDGMTIAERLEGHMMVIAKDVKACGSACDAYLKKSFLAKTVKSGTYEARLSEFATTFIDHRKKLAMAFSIHTSLAIDAANDKLDSQAHRLSAIEDKLDDMMALFRKLDTPREREVRRFIEEHGGVKACLGSDELLEELIVKSGESVGASASGLMAGTGGSGSGSSNPHSGPGGSGIAGNRSGGKDGGGRKSTGVTSSDVSMMRKKLFRELAEDVDEVFKRNMVLFEKKLEMQGRLLGEVVKDESERVISTLLAGAHDRIKDPDLQKIWKDMGWKGSVKARHFVLALHDYYTDKLSKTSTSGPNSPIIERQSSMSASSTSSSGTSTPPINNYPKKIKPRASSNALMLKRQQEDKWALTYINAAYVQPILEAVDDDGTGFVSVKEVNTFVDSRPDGWSLPHWIAYWAVGWQASISRYKSQIYTLIHRLFSTLPFVLPSNRRAVDEYLFHPTFWRIELLLRSTRSVNPKILQDPDLGRITEAYSREEEERIEGNLRDVGYELDTPEMITLVTGEGRIERFVFPLIYLLLRHHLKIITVGCKHVLDPEELSCLNDSLVSILVSIDYRIQNLEAVFKQTHLDVQARLGNFAFGMFQLSHGDIRRIPIQNSFGSWVSDDESSNAIIGSSSNQETMVPTEDSIKSLASSIPHSILKYGIQDAFHSTDYFEFEPHRLRRVSHALQGTWTGHCSRLIGGESVTFVIRLSLRVGPDLRTIYGKGEDYLHTFELQGKVKREKTGYSFLFTVTDDGTGEDSGMTTTALGALNTTTDVMTMEWDDRRRKENPDDPRYTPFTLRRIHPSLFRYRYTPSQFNEDRARSRWAFACNASLHQARAKLWSRCFFEARFGERKRFVELSRRSLVVEMGVTPQRPLEGGEKVELERLRMELDPAEARFYQALAEFDVQKLAWHPAWGCDWCERRITQSRLLCLQCMSEDLSDNIDLCITCFQLDKVPTKRGFTHQVSHDLVKVEETLHDYHFASVVESARVAVERVKGLFRAMEAANGGSMGLGMGMDDVSYSGVGSVHVPGGSSAGGGSQPGPMNQQQQQGQPAGLEMICVCCNGVVSTPCWACVVCPTDTFVCVACDAQKRPPRSETSPHKLTHPLIRIRDTSSFTSSTTPEERLNALHQRLLTLEHKMTSSLNALSSTIDQRLSKLELDVERRLGMFEAKAELRFDTLEAVLKQVVAQTAALPSIYTQVVKEQMRIMQQQQYGGMLGPPSPLLSPGQISPSTTPPPPPPQRSNGNGAIPARPKTSPGGPPSASSSPNPSRTTFGFGFGQGYMYGLGSPRSASGGGS